MQEELHVYWDLLCIMRESKAILQMYQMQEELRVYWDLLCIR